MIKITIDKINEKKSIKNKDFSKYSAIKRSILKYGQLLPIIVNENYDIIKGNTVYKILKELNYTEIYVKIVNVKNEKQLQMELSLSHHESNPITCFEIMQSLDSNHCLPFSKKEIIDFTKLLKFNWSQYDKQKDINDLF